jgi:hypothetical protein
MLSVTQNFFIKLCDSRDKVLAEFIFGVCSKPHLKSNENTARYWIGDFHAYAYFLLQFRYTDVGVTCCEAYCSVSRLQHPKSRVSRQVSVTFHVT